MMMRLRESGAVTSSWNNLPIIAFSIHNDPRPSVKVTLSVFMAKIAIFGLAKSGTTGLWSRVILGTTCNSLKASFCHLDSTNI